MNYLLLEGDDGVAGGVEQDAAVVEAEDFAFDLEHEVAVKVGDCKGSLFESHQLPRDGEISVVSNAELRAHDGDATRRRRIARAAHHFLLLFFFFSF